MFNTIKIVFEKIFYLFIFWINFLLKSLWQLKWWIVGISYCFGTYWFCPAINFFINNFFFNIILVVYQLQIIEWKNLFLFTGCGLELNVMSLILLNKFLVASIGSKFMKLCIIHFKLVINLYTIIITSLLKVLNSVCSFSELLTPIHRIIYHFPVVTGLFICFIFFFLFIWELGKKFFFLKKKIVKTAWKNNYFSLKQFIYMYVYFLKFKKQKLIKKHGRKKSFRFSKLKKFNF